MILKKVPRKHFQITIGQVLKKLVGIYHSPWQERVLDLHTPKISCNLNDLMLLLPLKRLLKFLKLSIAHLRVS